MTWVIIIILLLLLIFIGHTPQRSFAHLYLQLNPQHCIPTLDDNELVLWESRVILTYLVSMYGKDDALYPKDIRTRAMVDQRLHFDLGTLYQRTFEYFVSK